MTLRVRALMFSIREEGDSKNERERVGAALKDVCVGVGGYVRVRVVVGWSVHLLQHNTGGFVQQWN